jgi:hypothetical protein
MSIFCQKVLYNEGGGAKIMFFFTLKTSKEKIRTWEDFWFWAGFLHFWRPWFGLIRFIGCFLRVLDKKNRVGNKFMDGKNHGSCFSDHHSDGFWDLRCIIIFLNRLPL